MAALGILLLGKSSFGSRWKEGLEQAACSRFGARDTPRAPSNPGNEMLPGEPVLSFLLLSQLAASTSARPAPPRGSLLGLPLAGSGPPLSPSFGSDHTGLRYLVMCHLGPHSSGLYHPSFLCLETLEKMGL